MKWVFKDLSLRFGYDDESDGWIKRNIFGLVWFKVVGIFPPEYVVKGFYFLDLIIGTSRNG